jgi:Cu/Ag efflux protein CusF
MLWSETACRMPRALSWTVLIGLAPAVVAAADVRAQGMQNMPGMGAPKQATTVSGTGTVTAVNAANRKVTLDHGPIPAIQWPAMKMEFPTAPSVDLSKVKTGDKVQFTLSGSGSSYTVQSMNPAP